MNQKQLTETVRKFFDHIEWQYDFDETDNYFMTGSRFEGGVEYCNVIVDVEDEFVHCYAVVPFEVPAERRADAAEFVTRANSGMKRGAFELTTSTAKCASTPTWTSRKGRRNRAKSSSCSSPKPRSR